MSRGDPCDMDNHRWRDRPNKPGFICEDCQEVFPCKEKDCGHHDCILFRTEHEIKTVCTYCRKPIDLTVGNNTVKDDKGTVLFKHYSINIRKNSKAICEKCLDNHQITEIPDNE